MDRSCAFSRRTFLATSSAALVANNLQHSNSARAGEDQRKLAILGGEKAVHEPTPSLVRWGEPEREQLVAAVNQNSLFYWKGPQTSLLAERFRSTCPLKHVMTCSSGTAAIHIAVAAAGVGPGDEVITTPITDIGTVIGVLFQQAVPIFADIDRNTYNLDPDDVARRITGRTKAIIAVHLAGNPCRMDALKALADKHRLLLIEDCAQAWGARYNGEPVGTLGHLACFSLQHSKHVTCGDGGIVATNDDQFGPLLQRFGDKGFDRVRGGGLFESFATNYRMSELQAAFAAAQLNRLETIAIKRARLGNLFGEKIGSLSGIEPHGIQSADRCTYWFYMLRMRPGSFSCDRSQFVRALIAEGVPASGGYIPVPLYGNPVFQNHTFFAGRWPVKELGLTTMDYTQVSCPEAENILQSGIRIVINEAMSESYILSLVDAMHKVASHYAV